MHALDYACVVIMGLRGVLLFVITSNHLCAMNYNE